MDALFVFYDVLLKRGVDVKFVCNVCGVDLKSIGVFYYVFFMCDFDLCLLCFFKGVYLYG